MKNSGQLLSQASQGSLVAMDELLERHLPGLHAFVRLRAGELVRAKESVTDLVQSVCREVLADPGDFSYRGEAQFRRWLYTAALRKIIDKGRYYRAEKRDPRREVRGHSRGADDSYDAAASRVFGTFLTPSRDAMAHEELAKLEAAFEELPDHYREVILMARIYGMSHPEIGEQLSKSPEAVRMLLGRALARLSSLMKKTPPSDERPA